MKENALGQLTHYQHDKGSGCHLAALVGWCDGVSEYPLISTGPPLARGTLAGGHELSRQVTSTRTCRSTRTPATPASVTGSGAQSWQRFYLPQAMASHFLLFKKDRNKHLCLQPCRRAAHWRPKWISVGVIEFGPSRHQSPLILSNPWPIIPINYGNGSKLYAILPVTHQWPQLGNRSRFQQWFLLNSTGDFI